MAAATASLFDEPARAVVDVTPRGSSWRPTTRAAVTGLPLLTWVGVVLVRTGDLPLSRPGWLLLGTAVIAVVSPLVVVGLLDLESPYPMGTFGGGVLALWLSLGAGAAVVVAAVLAPTPRRRVARS